MRPITWIPILWASIASAQDFQRGDVNADGAVNIADPVAGLNYLFAGGSAPPCMDALDGNDDGEVNIADAVSILFHLFGGRALPPPAGACGPDPTPDDLGCDAFPPCPACPDACYPPEAFEEMAWETLEEGACLPSPVAEFDVLWSTIRVCPGGTVCGSGEPGCQIEFTVVDFDIDGPGGVATVHAEGHVEDLPIDIEDRLLGRVTHCSATVDFTVDGRGRFATRDVGCGYLEVTEVEGFWIDSAQLEMSVGGGGGCGLLDTLSDLFQETFEQEIATQAEEALAAYESEIVGMVICPPP